MSFLCFASTARNREQMRKSAKIDRFILLASLSSFIPTVLNLLFLRSLRDWNNCRFNPESPLIAVTTLPVLRTNIRYDARRGRVKSPSASRM